MQNLLQPEFYSYLVIDITDSTKITHSIQNKCNFEVGTFGHLFSIFVNLPNCINLNLPTVAREELKFYCNSVKTIKDSKNEFIMYHDLNLHRTCIKTFQSQDQKHIYSSKRVITFDDDFNYSIYCACNLIVALHRNKCHIYDNKFKYCYNLPIDKTEIVFSIFYSIATDAFIFEIFSMLCDRHEQSDFVVLKNYRSTHNVIIERKLVSCQGSLIFDQHRDCLICFENKQIKCVPVF